ncbi:MAG TPA: DNA mismatch repair protein MutS, partial [Devosia sp.]|nr:DNA mismatch repair protein MutS [Devosia sp.]
MDQAPYVSSPSDKSADAPVRQAGKKPIVTPMMAQFFEIKAVNPGYLLFYRMGDFYELFFEDAEIASGALGIVLTTRGKHLGKEIPMCGVPVHAAQDYLKKLIRLGHRVAICEQLEDPAEAKKRGSKSVVKRDVVRLVTPGTLTEDDLLPAGTNNFLGALSMISHGEFDFALAWADISTGETFVVDLGENRLADELARLNLAELILAPATEQKLGESKILPEGLVRHVAMAAPETFDSEEATASLKSAFPQIEVTGFTRAARSALGALIAYVAETQKTASISLRAPEVQTATGLMQIDLATRTSLEILATNRGEAKGSLRHTIDRTVTTAGARLLARRLSAPLIVPDHINKRLDMVETFVADTIARETLREHLRQTPDLTRPLTRLALERGGPRDLVHVGFAINSARQLAEKLAGMDDLPAGLVELAQVLDAAPGELAVRIKSAIEPSPSVLVRDGGFVREGFDAELDEQRGLATKSRTVISELQAALASQTDIRALKIKHNRVLGFFVEVPATHGKKLLDEPFLNKFIHRQTMANAMRFTTAELGELEGRIVRAQGRALEIEQVIFDRLLGQVL